MGRLITLQLQPFTRPINHPPSPSTCGLSPPIPAKSPRRTKSKMSFALPLPCTQKQWRTVLDEVRAKYLKRQYKQCSARCIELLEGAPDTVLSLHYIYLSFYAAICLELLARPLPIGYPKKLQLFNLARVYYQKCENYMWEVESEHLTISPELVRRTSLEMQKSFPSSSSNPSEISPRSSVTFATDSHNPYTSSFSSPMHSPASSVCSSFSKSEEEECDPLKPRPLRVKKTVSFHTSLPTIISSSAIIDTTSSARTSKIFQSGLDDLSLQPTTSCPTTTAALTTDAFRPDTVSSLLISRSIARYNTHLTSLRTRLKHHLCTITDLISSIQQSTHHQQQLASNTDTPHHYYSDTDRRDKRGNLPTTSFGAYRSALPDIVESELEKAQRRRARIAQLEQRGAEWRLGRGRFDGSRYEQLCQEALRELRV